MPQFQYQALDQQGTARDGCIDASNESAAITKLRARSLYVLEIHPRKVRSQVLGQPGSGSSSASRKSYYHRFLERFQPIGTGEQVFFFRQLAVMLRSGLPLLQSLEVCQVQGSNRRLKKHIREIVDGIQSGKRFSQCLHLLKGVFPYTAIRLIETGEASGELDHVLERVATHLEMKVGLRSKIITSLAYPAIVIFTAVGVTAFLTWAVIPKFADYFAKRKLELPASTEALLQISGLLQQLGPWLILGGVGVAIAMGFVWRNTAGRLFLSRRASYIPVVGKIMEVSSMAQMGKTLSLLLGSGLTVTESLQVTASTTGNPAYKNGLSLSVSDILKGQSLSESLDQEDFPALVKQMISVGEQTGELSLALQQMGSFYESELQTRIQRMTVLIEPFILFFIGGTVGFVYFAFFKAVFQIASSGN